MTDKKKLAAAVAAVFTCIRTQEEAAMTSPAGPPAGADAAPAEPQAGFRKPNLWGVSGRQNQMQLRSMMQLRMFK